MRICLCLCAAVWFLLCACSGVRSEMPADALSERDTLVTVTESADDADSTEIAAPAPPKTADLLFDDFIYGFMRSRNFQLQRVVFPLPCVTDGESSSITRGAWRFDRLYARSDVYLMIFESKKKVNSSKNLKIKHVAVEMLDFDECHVRSYAFDKLDGSWMLTRIDERAFEEHEDGEFYMFYHHFSTDEEFQHEHLASSIAFRTFDDDSFEHIEGTLAPDQWPDFRPELPVGRQANINYGQDLSSSDTRVVVVASGSTGMNCMLTFRRVDGDWILFELEN